MWTCATCGAEHPSLPLCFGAGAPWRGLVSEEEFARRVQLTDDQCVVDDDTFFLRGHIELPILGTSDVFSWPVWCSLSVESFRHVAERWENTEREGDTYFGWLCTGLPTYPSTLHMKANVRSRAVGVCPLVELQACEHPLYVEQRDGLTLARVQEIAHLLLDDGTSHTP